MESFAKWMERQHLSEDKFQSFVCWSLFVGALLALLPPTLIYVFENSSVGCVGVHFIVLGQYATSPWLVDMFEGFKNESVATDVDGDDDDVCYQLIIGDSGFDTAYQPSVWMPENFMWVDIAEAELQALKGLSGDFALIGNRTRDCVLTTSQPLGLITWTKLAPFLSATSDVVSYQALINLVQQGWHNYTDGAVDGLYPSLVGGGNLSALGFAHGHPNVTSGGILSLAAAFSELASLADAATLVWADITPALIASLSLLEKSMDESTPVDVTLVSLMLERGPTFIQIGVGVESDVLMANLNYRALMETKYGDTLTFLYLRKGFWLDNPVCILSSASWMDSKTLSIAQKFLDYVDVQQRKNQLVEYGIRPAGLASTTLLTHKFWNSTLYGGSGAVTIEDPLTWVYGYPSATTAQRLQYLWQSMKKPVYLKILLDVSNNMNTEISLTEIRWSYIQPALAHLVEALEDSAIVDLTCFAEQVVPCADAATEYPGTNTTLGVARADIVTFIEKQLVRKGVDDLNVYATVKTAFDDLSAIRAADVSDHFRYILMILTEDQSTPKKAKADKADLLNTITEELSADDIHIYPISYYSVKHDTATALATIALRSNGVFSHAKENLQQVVQGLSFYF